MLVGMPGAPQQDAGAQHRRENKRHLVSNTTCRMLVNSWLAGRGPLQTVTTVHHGMSESDGFLESHSAKIDCHGEGGHLIVGYAIRGILQHELLNLAGVEFFPVSFASDDRCWSQCLLFV